MIVHTNFPGGCAKNLSLKDGLLMWEIDMRDIGDNWFYWAFCVEGAAGESVTFRCTGDWVGPHGAAVSHDLATWEWSESALDGGAFTYEFQEGENRVYFAHHMLYNYQMLDDYTRAYGLAVDIPVCDRRGTPIPVITVGEGDKVILLTARHHACESTGDYVMQGFAEAFLSEMPAGYRLIMVPFVDADGVHFGDQGKGRYPHDHNRDYSDTPLYPGVALVQKIIKEENPLLFFDLHSPWHRGDRNDTIFWVRKNHVKRCDLDRLSRCFEEASKNGEGMPYQVSNDIEEGVEWNTAVPTISAAWCHANCPSSRVALTLESTYFGLPDCPVTQERLLLTGCNLYRACRAFLQED